MAEVDVLDCRALEAVGCEDGDDIDADPPPCAMRWLETWDRAMSGDSLTLIECGIRVRKPGVLSLRLAHLPVRIPGPATDALPPTGWPSGLDAGTEVDQLCLSAGDTIFSTAGLVDGLPMEYETTWGRDNAGWHALLVGDRWLRWLVPAGMAARADADARGSSTTAPAAHDVPPSAGACRYRSADGRTAPFPEYPTGDATDAESWMCAPPAGASAPARLAFFRSDAKPPAGAWPAGLPEAAPRTPGKADLLEFEACEFGATPWLGFVFAGKRHVVHDTKWSAAAACAEAPEATFDLGACEAHIELGDGTAKGSFDAGFLDASGGFVSDVTCAVTVHTPGRVPIRHAFSPKKRPSKGWPRPADCEPLPAGLLCLAAGDSTLSFDAEDLRTCNGFGRWQAVAIGPHVLRWNQ
ncbi:MAG TPA: hypothetical protein VG389_27965 [Myxococcota bacterium]|jgi:hypothetical protein|nr:hypothetical protein [Myxococcota bacterium]